MLLPALSLFPHSPPSGETVRTDPGGENSRGKSVTKQGGGCFFRLKGLLFAGCPAGVCSLRLGLLLAGALVGRQ